MVMKKILKFTSAKKIKNKIKSEIHKFNLTCSCEKIVELLHILDLIFLKRLINPLQRRVGFPAVFQCSYSTGSTKSHLTLFFFLFLIYFFIYILLSLSLHTHSQSLPGLQYGIQIKKCRPPLFLHHHPFLLSLHFFLSLTSNPNPNPNPTPQPSHCSTNHPLMARTRIRISLLLYHHRNRPRFHLHRHSPTPPHRLSLLQQNPRPTLPPQAPTRRAASGLPSLPRGRQARRRSGPRVQQLNHLRSSLRQRRVLHTHRRRNPT